MVAEIVLSSVIFFSSVVPKVVVFSPKVITPKSIYSVFTATAYCRGESGGDVTASGNKCRVGLVAVDPQIIPLGTKLYVEGINDDWVYGECVADDTGGLIKGNKIDLFVDSWNEMEVFGVRKCKVYILD